MIQLPTVDLPTVDELSTGFWLTVIVFVASTLWLLRHILRANAHARHEARTARSDLAAAHTANRVLVSHLAHRGDVQLVLVPVAADTDQPPAIHPLTVLLLVLWSQAVAEREAFRAWVTEDPLPADLTPQLLQAFIAQAAGTAATKDTP